VVTGDIAAGSSGWCTPMASIRIGARSKHYHSFSASGFTLLQLGYMSVVYRIGATASDRTQAGEGRAGRFGRRGFLDRSCHSMATARALDPFRFWLNRGIPESV
jgi:hypothetical protein